MEIPAFETQYSPLLTEDTWDEQDEMLIIVPRLPPYTGCFIICRAAACVMNMFPFVLVPIT